MPTRRLLRLAAAALSLAHPVAARAQTPAGFDRAWADVHALFASSLGRQGIAGGSLWFVRDDQILAHDDVGLADRATGRAVDDSTIYHWASITKTFTAIGIMQLRDRGFLRLDDPAVKYIPELRMVHDTFGDISAVTIRQLMSHSAGFRNPTWPWAGDKPWHPFEPTQWSQLVAMMPYTELLFAPGTRFGYSNPGIVFLGIIIERLTGDDYEVYVDKNILKPLEMYHSYFDVTPYHLLRFRSNSYDISHGRVTPVGLDFDTGITVSNGGLNAPLTDMAKYLAFLVGAPARRAAYDGVLKQSSLEEMWRPILPVPGDGAEGDSVTAGFFVLDRGGRRYVGKTGSQAGFRSFFYIQPGSHTAAIGVTNTSGSSDTPGSPDADASLMLRTVRDRIIERVFPLFH